MSPEYVATSRDGSAERTLEFVTGKFIFREGDLGTEMYIVHEGQVEILQELPDGSRQLAVLEKGDFFGEMSILEELPRNASAKALTNATVIMIDGATFDSMLRANPEIAVRIMRKLSRRLRQADELVKRVLAGEDAESAAKEEVEEVRPPADPDAARLVHPESGLVFVLPLDGSITIGRRDPVTGIQPDIDLTGIDPERSSSRRHAKIFREGRQFYLVEDIGATNGTFLNASRVRTGVPVEIGPGDTVRFGLVELSLVAD
jgi:CRP-like cAMP-binding protein